MESINEDEIRKAIKRSGYLLESRINKLLTDNGYGILPSERYSDPKTGVDREIDIIGISNWCTAIKREIGIKVNHELIIECSNNPQPVVFFKQEGDDNNVISIHVPFASWTSAGESEKIKNLKGVAMVELTHSGNFFNVALPSVQYCSFVQKKGTKDWMALHPDDVHSMMNKFKDYLEHRLETYDTVFPEVEEGSFRHIMFRMVWVTTNDLYLATEKEGEVVLSKENVIFYLHKFSDKHQLRGIIVDVVTEGSFKEYLAMNKEVDTRLLAEMVNKLD